MHHYGRKHIHEKYDTNDKLVGAVGGRIDFWDNGSPHTPLVAPPPTQPRTHNKAGCPEVAPCCGSRRLPAGAVEAVHDRTWRVVPDALLL